MAQRRSTFIPVLHTSRLTLPLLDLDNPVHVDHVLRCFNDPVTLENMGDYGITTPEKLKETCDACLLPASLCGGVAPNRVAAWIIQLRSTAEDNQSIEPCVESSSPWVGVISLLDRGGTLPPDMGWMMLQQYSGKGYATEAGRELLRYFTEDLGIRDIIAWLKPTNLPSVRTAEKIGFVEAGTVKNNETGAFAAVYALPGMKRYDGTDELNFYGGAK